MSFKPITLILLILCVILTIQLDYPKNINITKRKQYDSPRSIEIESKAVLDSHISNSEYTIVVFHMDWCAHCKHFIPVFDQASTYQLARKFSFLKVNCSHREICNALKVDRYPTTKVYHKGTELNTEPLHELEPFLEYIDKLTSNPIVKVTDLNKFYASYGTSSPLIKYNENKTEFQSCISYLAKNEYSSVFYFGIMPIKANDTNSGNGRMSSDEEMLVFDYNGQGNSLIYEWKNDCEAMWLHLDENRFPLMLKVDSITIKKLQRSNRTSILLFGDANEDKQIQFIKTKYTKLSMFNREKRIVFGYVDINTDKELATHLKIEYKGKPRLLVYDFTDYKYYIEPIELDIEKEEECYLKIMSLIKGVNGLKYTTGSKLDDFLMIFGMKSNSQFFPFVILGALVVIILIILGIVILCEKCSNDETASAYANANANPDVNKQKKD